MFTFVHTTDGPGLSASGAKKMRAHVTKTNFARRRRRLAVEQWQQQADYVPTSRKALVETPPQPQKSRSRRRPAPVVAGLLNWDSTSGTDTDSATSSSSSSSSSASSSSGSSQSPEPAPSKCRSLLSVQPTDPYLSVRYLVESFRPLVFPEGSGCAESLREAEWAELLISEPALLESTLAIGVRHNYNYPLEARNCLADVHASNAISIVNKRLNEGETALTDGVLGAVFTLAFGERLMHNDLAWRVHIDGLCRMVNLRMSQGDKKIPTWFTDLLLYDSYLIHPSAPRTEQYQAIQLALRGGRDEVHVDVSMVAQDMEKLRQSLEIYYNYNMKMDFVEQEIKEPMRRLDREADFLIHGTGSYLRAIGRSIKIYLPLAWPEGDVDLPQLASELRDALENPSLRLCSSVDLTVWQFFLGGIASQKGSLDYKWFCARLRRVLLAIPVQSWTVMEMVIARGFMPDSRLLGQFRELWEDIDRLI